MIVKVIRPSLRMNADYVLYPYRLYHIKLKFRRIFGSEKCLDYFAYVDCIRLGVERGDGISIEEWDVERDKIMKEIVSEEVAKKEAIKSALSWGNMVVVSWWYPKIEIVKSLKAYKVFWIKNEVIIDSLSGETFEIKS